MMCEDKSIPGIRSTGADGIMKEEAECFPVVPSTQESIMAEMKKFVVESDVRLAYFDEEDEGRHVLLQPELLDAVTSAAIVGSDAPAGERLETKIANELNFPTEEEFNGLFRDLDHMRAQGIRPAAGVPNVTRDGVRLRITVEVL